MAQQTLADTDTDAQTEQPDTPLRPVPQPTVERVVGLTTPFPQFDESGAWRVGETVHDTTLAHLRRVVESEVTDA